MRTKVYTVPEVHMKTWMQMIRDAGSKAGVEVGLDAVRDKLTLRWVEGGVCEANFLLNLLEASGSLRRLLTSEKK